MTMLTRRQREELQQQRLEAARAKARRIQSITENLIEANEAARMLEQEGSPGCTRLSDVVGGLPSTGKPRTQRVPLTGRPLASVHSASPRAS